jgi:DNA-binding NarL/FixJ family response regulator
MAAPSQHTQDPVRVLIVDDHKLFADALSLFLERDHRIEVIGTASSGREAVDLALARYADVVLMDVFMRGMDGIEATKELRSVRPEAHVIVLSGIDSDDLGEQARAAGADGHLQKGLVHDKLVDAVLRAAQGQPPFA